MMQRLDWSDKAAFVVVVCVAMVLAYLLYKAGRDGGAIALLSTAAALLSAYFGQVNATAAREAALLAPAPRPAPPPLPPSPTGGP